MHPKCVYAILGWLKFRDKEVTLYRFFAVAYTVTFAMKHEQFILTDMALFEKDGIVPDYVASFMRKKMYPGLIHVNEAPERKLLL